MVAWAIAAAAGAALSYAIAAAYMKRRASTVDAAAIAAGSQLGATLALAPLLVPLPPLAWPTPGEWWAAVLLGVVCLYFRLIADVGPTRALTVTFLIPVFGMLWGALFLGEAITPTMVAGCALVLIGTVLIVRPDVRLRGDPASAG